MTFPGEISDPCPALLGACFQDLRRLLLLSLGLRWSESWGAHLDANVGKHRRALLDMVFFHVQRYFLLEIFSFEIGSHER